MRRVLALLCLIAAVVAFTPARAQADTIELALLIDASGSISTADYDLQRLAYANVLGSVVPVDGRVALGVWQFGQNVVQMRPMTVMNTTTLADFVAMFNGMTRAGVSTGATAIGDAIGVAWAALLPGMGFDQQIIDVSTDGANNYGSNPDTVAAAAVVAGLERVNCLGVGIGTADCGFIAGTGAFAVNVNLYSEFEVALRNKIGTELGVIPEPASMLLLGTGLLGLGRAWRKRRG